MHYEPWGGETPWHSQVLCNVVIIENFPKSICMAFLVKMYGFGAIILGFHEWLHKALRVVILVCFHLIIYFIYCFRLCKCKWWGFFF